MRRILLALCLFLVSCVEVKHSGEVDLNHEITINDIDIILTVDTASEISGDVTVKAGSIAEALAATFNSP